jgi:hypothetical protein
VLLSWGRAPASSSIADARAPALCKDIDVSQGRSGLTLEPAHRAADLLRGASGEGARTGGLRHRP